MVEAETHDWFLVRIRSILSAVDANFPHRAVVNLVHVVPDFTTPSPITTTTAIRTEESNSDAAAVVISSVVERKGEYNRTADSLLEVSYVPRTYLVLPFPP